MQQHTHRPHKRRAAATVRTSLSVKPTEVRNRIIGKTGFLDKKGAWVQKF
jgi:hypothetical protein